MWKFLGPHSHRLRDQLLATEALITNSVRLHFKIFEMSTLCFGFTLFTLLLVLCE